MTKTLIICMSFLCNLVSSALIHTPLLHDINFGKWCFYMLVRTVLTMCHAFQMRIVTSDEVVMSYSQDVMEIGQYFEG